MLRNLASLAAVAVLGLGFALSSTPISRDADSLSPSQTLAELHRLHEAEPPGSAEARRLSRLMDKVRRKAAQEEARAENPGAFLEALAQIEAGTLSEEPQVHEHATYAPKMSRASARLDWRLPAEELDRVQAEFEAAHRERREAAKAFASARHEGGDVERAREGYLQAGRRVEAADAETRRLVEPEAVTRKSGDPRPPNPGPPMRPSKSGPSRRRS